MLSANPQYIAITITSIKEEVPGVKTFTVAAQDGSDIPFIAGQFITFVFTHHAKEERRSFSISSVPGGPLSFTVKRVDNGAYSRLLTDRAKAGDILFTTGASGLFTLPQNIAAYRQVFFFAAGIGITPVISLIKTLLIMQPAMHVTLIYSNRSQQEVVFYDELQALATTHPQRFTMELLYSTSFHLARARLNKALVPVLMQEYTTVPKETVLCYVCGPYSYMRMAIWSLEEWGIPGAHIRRENFNTNDRAINPVVPPDTDAHTVTINHNRQQYTITVQYPETILHAAKKAGIPLPYSCEAGRCGSCAARCIKGAVWLSYNEVLIDTDVKHGSILTCTGYPVGGDVVIEA